MLKKKGFTLIELLAVIVILAIVALIAAPVILNIIDSSKEESNEITVKNYKKAVENALIRSEMNKKTIAPGTYQIINDGNICLSDLVNNTCPSDSILKVELDGNHPTKGNIEINKNKVKTFILYFDTFYVIMNSNGEITINKLDTYTGTICTSVKSSKKGSIPSGNYLPGDEYICQVNDTDTYNFYILSTDGDKVNLIMNHNLVDNVPFFAEDYDMYENPLTYSYEGDWNYIQSAITDVEDLTVEWTNIPKLNETHEDKGKRYTRYLNGRARLPKFSEIRDNACSTYYYKAGDYEYYGDCASWILGNYWTMDTDLPYMYLWAVNTKYNSLDQFQYEFIKKLTNVDNPFGIRPVISLSKINLK